MLHFARENIEINGFGVKGLFAVGRHYLRENIIIIIIRRTVCAYTAETNIFRISHYG